MRLRMLEFHSRLAQGKEDAHTTLGKWEKNGFKENKGENSKIRIRVKVPTLPIPYHLH